MSIDLTDLLRRQLARDNRPGDGKLHSSSDLIGSLRHAQLRAAGAPTKPPELGSDINLMIGTLFHSYFERMLKEAHLPVMTEVKLGQWMPEGWEGTADILSWEMPRVRGFRLKDLKTTKPEGIEWIERGGAKEEHVWQTSSYWHALVTAGLPMENEIEVYYLPKGMVAGKDIQPVATAFEPLDRDLVYGVMEDRWQATTLYLQALYSGVILPGAEPDYLNEYLAPEQKRVQKCQWSKVSSSFELKLLPHWSAAYCPFPDELCACNTTGQTKIGQYSVDGIYTPRNGYERIEPLVAPKPFDLRTRKAELNV